MTDCEHKQLILTSQCGTDGFPIYSCGVPLAIKELVAKWRDEYKQVDVADPVVQKTLNRCARELEALQLSGCGALFKVKPEEITVEQQLTQDEIDFMNAPLGPTGAATTTSTQPRLNAADVLNVLAEMTDGLLWKQPEEDGHVSRFTDRLNKLLEVRP